MQQTLTVFPGSRPLRTYPRSAAGRCTPVFWPRNVGVVLRIYSSRHREYLDCSAINTVARSDEHWVSPYLSTRSSAFLGSGFRLKVYGRCISFAEFTEMQRLSRQVPLPQGIMFTNYLPRRPNVPPPNDKPGSFLVGGFLSD